MLLKRAKKEKKEREENREKKIKEERGRDEMEGDKRRRWKKKTDRTRELHGFLTRR